MTVVQSIELFFQEATSDKVYNASIVEENGLFTVRVEWGRRGSTLSTGTKAVKTTRALAQKVFDRVVAEKVSKGYEAITEDVQPARVAPPEGEGSASRVAGPSRERRKQAAQHLNAIDDDALERVLRDDEMIAQQKLDGARVIVHVEEDVVATNRKGQVTEIARRVIEVLRRAPRGTVIDGELVGGGDRAIYWAFDLLQIGAQSVHDEGYVRRHARLSELVRGWPSHPALRIVPMATTHDEKKALFDRLRAERAEGIVFKHARAAYKAGRPASGGGQLKYKFVKSADVFITANVGNAYQMAVYDEGEVRSIGKVFAGTTNESRAELDELLSKGERPVAEVRYLYATEQDVLFQPVFVRLRDDKEPDDCLLSQLVRTNRAVIEDETSEPAADAEPIEQVASPGARPVKEKPWWKTVPAGAAAAPAPPRVVAGASNDLADGEEREVKGSAAQPYVLKNVGGVYSCTCPAWRNQSLGLERRTCKHLRALRGDAAEDARVGSAVGATIARRRASGDEKGPPVLLAHSWEGDVDLTGWWMSEKLDGVRAYWDGQAFISRLGNPYVAPDWFVEGLPDTPLDGELWGGRKKFQRTVSVVRRQDKSEGWRDIVFVVFDAPAIDAPFEERLEHVRRELEARELRHARHHAHERCRSIDHLKEELARVESMGGEGLMMRKPGSRYEVGRSSTLLKVKTFHDAEGLVVEHLPGAGRHKGRLGALLCELPDGTRFSVGTGFSDEERAKPPKVGSVVTFRYQELSEAGVPRFPSYVGVRHDVAWPPENVPARKKPPIT